MATKNISISEEAYRRLVRRRTQSESFSELIIQLTNKFELLDLIGLLPNNAADEVEEIIAQNRAEAERRYNERASRIVKELSV